MKLITELTEDVSYLVEEKNGKKDFFIEGIFLQANIKNRNGRIYPSAIMEREVNRYIAEQVNQNRAYGELGHPNTPTINLDRVSHRIVELRKDGDNYIGKAKISSSPSGQIARGLMEDGGRLGVSSRGLGSLKEVNGVHEVQSDFMLNTAGDIVADPSAPDAYVRGIMEGREWVWNNGLLKEVEIDNHRKQINAAAGSVKPAKLEETMILVFEDFLQKIHKI
ncbi:MAG: primosomal protein [Thermoplasmata archaeon M11B2D]|nr:MAG: primosomal protein [Thermoplasmata archaeon M11B2D]